jgi:MEKHLA domain-containing protein
MDPGLSAEAQARELFYAPFVVLSHNTAPDPILNYANESGLRLFDLSWDELTVMPSRLTAQAPEQAERSRLLAQVSKVGFIDDYKGIRIAKNGRKFAIERATVWNLLDEDGAPYGQAATFSEWQFLD